MTHFMSIQIKENKQFSDFLDPRKKKTLKHKNKEVKYTSHIPSRENQSSEMHDFYADW